MEMDQFSPLYLLGSLFPLELQLQPECVQTTWRRDTGEGLFSQASSSGFHQAPPAHGLWVFLTLNKELVVPDVKTLLATGEKDLWTVFRASLPKGLWSRSGSWAWDNAVSKGPGLCIGLNFHPWIPSHNGPVFASLVQGPKPNPISL